MSIDKVAVLGGGLMGSGIAESVALAGLPVIVRDIDDAAVGGAEHRIGASLQRAASRGKFDADEVAAIRERIVLTTELDDIADVDLVIEAVPENAELKANILSQVAGIVSADTLISSNTSSIPIAQLAAGLPRPERVLGLHFFSPVPVMPLVEVVSASASARSSPRTARASSSTCCSSPT
jgi:3-hydroxybutyryl-CoA dehydrogenase